MVRKYSSPLPASKTTDIMASNISEEPSSKNAVGNVINLNKPNRAATYCLILSIMGWILYITLIPSIICAVLSLRYGLKSRKNNMKTKRVYVGLVLDVLLLCLYGISCILVILFYMFYT